MGEEKKGFFKRLVSGLTKTRDNIISGITHTIAGFASLYIVICGMESMKKRNIPIKSIIPE